MSPYVPPRIIENNGTVLAMRPVVNVVPPAVASDDPVNGATIITVSSSGSATPTLVASGATFEIAADTQMVFKAPNKIDGTLKITGTLVQT